MARGEEKGVGRKTQRMLGESVTTKIKPTSVRKTGLFSKMHAMSLKMKKAESVKSVESEESVKEVEKENGNSADGSATPTATPTTTSSTTTTTSTTNTPKPSTLSSLSSSLRRTRKEEEEEEKKKRDERRRLFCSRLKAAPEENETQPKPVEKGIKRFFRSNSSKSQPFPAC